MSTPEVAPQKLSVELPLVTELINEQFPELASQQISRLGSTGTENAVYRLGEKALIRLPTTESAARQVDKEQRWLPHFAQANLPLAIPQLIAPGAPSEQYPHSWSIYNWIKGKPATTERITNIHHAAVLLGQFVATLQTIDTTDGPAPGEHNFFRGVPLAERDPLMQRALKTLHADGFDTAGIDKVWEDAITAAPWDDKPVWIHGDLADSNMLAKRRRKRGDSRDLTAVIDFGGTAVGDPACDLIIGWDVVAEERDRFLHHVQPDTDTIRRGRGWAVSTAAVSLVRFPDKPAIKTCALRKINEATSSI